MLFLVEANSFLEVADCNLYDTCNFFAQQTLQETNRKS